MLAGASTSEVDAPRLRRIMVWPSESSIEQSHSLLGAGQTLGAGPLPEPGSSSREESDWVYLGRELRRRTIEPFGHVPFVFYLLIAVIFFGALGIWVELVKIGLTEPQAVQAEGPPGTVPASIDLGSLITAVITYFPALIGSAALQFALAQVNRTDKILITFALFMLIAFSIAAVLLSILSKAHGGPVLTVGLLFCVGAIWVWVIANADDVTFRRVPPKVDAASGGDPDRDLPGSLNGCQV